MHPLLFTAALALLLLAISVATWLSGRALRTFIPPNNLLLGLPDNLLRLFLILICVMLGLFLGPGAGPLGWEMDHLLRDAAIGAIAALVLFPVLNWMGNAVVRRWGPEMCDNRVLRAVVPIDRREWAGIVLALLTAAILEELLFRSLPLGELTWLVSTSGPAAVPVLSPWVMAWPLSLLFGLMHAPQGPWGIVGTSIMGLLLSALFLLSGSIYVPIVTHWLLNVAEVTIAQRQGLRPLRCDVQPRVTPPE